MIDLDKPWNDAPLAVIDVETTGLDPEHDRIIEVAIIEFRGGEVTQRYSTLVNPGRDVPPEVVKLTGIQPEELETAPRFADVAAAVVEHLEGRVFVAYNLAFDRAFVRTELERCGCEWPAKHYIDPLIFVRTLHKDQGSKRLGAVAERMGVTLESAHRAAFDAEVTGHILHKLAPQLPSTLRDLALLQSQWEAQQDNEMAGWRNKRGGGAIDASVGGDMADRGNSLGPAYIYGEDTDPVRAMFIHLPDSGSRR